MISHIANFQHKVICFVFSFIVSSFYIIGAQLDVSNEIDWSFNTLLTIFFLTMLIWPVSLIFFYCINNQKTKKKKYEITKKSKIIIAIIFGSIALTTYLAVLPGIFGYDSIYQIKQFLPNGKIGDHYSILFSALLSLFYFFGKTFLNSPNAGIAIFSFLQAGFMTFVFCKITYFIFGRTKNRTAGIITTIFFAINIFVHVMSVSICQDTIFSGLFALIFIQFVKIYNEPKEYFLKKKNLFILSVLILLLCLFRNNGIYIILFATTFGIVFIKEVRIRLLIVTLVPVTVFLLFSRVIVPSLGMHQPNNFIKEVSSIPSQQFARVYNRHKERYSESDLKNLKKYYSNIDEFKSYNQYPMISDSIKSKMRKNTHGDMINYISFWIKFGLKNKKDFVEAAMLHNLTLWYPEKKLNDSRMFHPYIEYDNTSKKLAKQFKTVTIERNSILPGYNKSLHNFIYQKGKNNWQQIPILRTILMPASYLMLLLMIIVKIIICRRWKLLFPLSLIVGLYICLILSPVIIFRYMLPVILCAPIITTLLFKEKENLSRNLIKKK